MAKKKKKNTKSSSVAVEQQERSRDEETGDIADVRSIGSVFTLVLHHIYVILYRYHKKNGLLGKRLQQQQQPWEVCQFNLLRNWNT